VKYTLKTAAGTELRSEVIGTIRKLGSDVTAGR
jgi:hypothetical protein